MEVSVPVDPKLISEFVEKRRDAYLKDLETVRARVTAAITSGRLRDVIYRIYSRSDSQPGNEMKHPGKIRLKAEQFCRERNLDKYDLYSMPDIVGFRLVVLFPSDIDSISKIIDDEVDGKQFFAVYGNKGEGTPIKTKHGKAQSDQGYYACHYYLKLADTTRSPLIEVQILTVLHDAWGAKTHDLTYKPTGKIDAITSNHFNALGDSLAGLDRQSDLLRQSIKRSSRAIEEKRRRVQLAATTDLVRQAVALEAMEPTLLSNVKDIASDAQKITETADRDSVASLERRIDAIFDSAPRVACVIAVQLAVRSNQPDSKFFALDHLLQWELMEKDPYRKLLARCHKAFFNYSFNNTAQSIEDGESALEWLRRERSTFMHHPRFKGLEISLLSNLAYFHAEAINTDYGRKGGSATKSKEYSDECLSQIKQLIGAESMEEGIFGVIDGLISEINNHPWLIEAMDTLVYCEVCVSSDLARVRAALDVLDRLNASRPGNPEPRPSYDYHKYCGQLRCLELETDSP